MTNHLHELPQGSVIAAADRADLVAVSHQCTPTCDQRPWYLADPSHGPYTVGDLLAMTQHWIVLRKGPTVHEQYTGDGSEPEVRHYICESGDLRGHITMTSREGHGGIVTDIHPWEPLTSEDGITWYRVSPAVAEEYDWDPDEDDERPHGTVTGTLRDLDQL